MNLKDIKIKEKEDSGRAKAISAFGKYNLVESPNINDCWDLSGCTQAFGFDDRNFFIEVKDRDVKSSDYDTAYLEYQKFTDLKYVSNHHYGDMFYACFYTDNKGFVWNLSKLNLKDVFLTIKEARKITADVNSELVDKLFIELPFSIAKPFYL